MPHVHNILHYASTFHDLFISRQWARPEREPIPCLHGCVVWQPAPRFKIFQSMPHDTKKVTATPTPETAHQFLERTEVTAGLYRCISLAAVIRLSLYAIANHEATATDTGNLWAVAQMLEDQLNDFNGDLETATMGLRIATA